MMSSNVLFPGRIFDIVCWLSSRNFFQGGSIVMQISFVMLLFSDQISERAKVFRGNCLRGGPAPPVEESQYDTTKFHSHWLSNREVT